MENDIIYMKNGCYNKFLMKFKKYLKCKTGDLMLSIFSDKKKYESKIGILEEEIEQLKKNMEKVKEEATEKIEEYTIKNSNLNAEVEFAKKYARGIWDEKITLEKERESYSEKINFLEDKIRNTDKKTFENIQLKNLNKQLIDENSQIQKKMQEIKEKEIQEINSKLKIIEKENEDLLQETIDLLEENKKLSENLTNLEKKEESYKKEIENLNKDKNIFLSEKMLFQDKYDELAETNSELLEELDQYHSLEANLAESEEEVQSLNENLEEAKNKIEHLESELERVKSETKIKNGNSTGFGLKSYSDKNEINGIVERLRTDNGFENDIPFSSMEQLKKDFLMELINLDGDFHKYIPEDCFDEDFLDGDDEYGIDILKLQYDSYVGFEKNYLKSIESFDEYEEFYEEHLEVLETLRSYDLKDSNTDNITEYLYKKLGWYLDKYTWVYEEYLQRGEDNSSEDYLYRKEDPDYYPTLLPNWPGKKPKPETNLNPVQGAIEEEVVLTFDKILSKGLKEGYVLASELSKVNYEDESYVGDYYEAVEELEMLDIKIIY